MSDFKPVVRFAPEVLKVLRPSRQIVVPDLDAPGSEELREVTSRWLRNVRDSEDAAIMNLIERTPGDERGILVTRTTVMSEQEMRMNTSVVRSDDVPSGTIRYQDEPGRMTL